MKNIVHNFIAKSDLHVEDSGITVIKKTGRVYTHTPLSKKKKSIISRDVAIELHVCVMRLFSMEVTWLQLFFIWYLLPITIYLKNKKDHSTAHCDLHVLYSGITVIRKGGLTHVHTPLAEKSIKPRDVAKATCKVFGVLILK